MAENATKIELGSFQLDRKNFYSLLAYIYLGAFIFISLFFGFSLPLFLLFFLVAAFFIIPSNLGLGLIIILTMIFERYFTLQPLVIDQIAYKLYPLDILIGLTILSWLLSFRFSKDKPKIFFGWPEKILVIFMLMNVVYMIASLVNVNADFDIAFSTFKNYTFYPILYFLVLFSVQKKKRLKEIMHLMLIGGSIIISFIIIGIARGQGLWTEFMPLSTSGVRLLAGTHSFYLLLTVIILLSLMIYKRFKDNLLPGIIMWVWVVGILLSMARHIWLALILGAALLFLLIPKKNKKTLKIYTIKNGLIIVSLILVYLLIVSLYPYQSLESRFILSSENIQRRFVSITDTVRDTSINWRIALWGSALAEWQKSPVFGIGFGKEIPLEVGSWRTFEEVRNLHNSSLAIFVQMGILGLAAIYAFILLVIRNSRKYIFKNKELAPYYLAILICAVLFIFVSFFQPYLETNLTGIFLWIFLGLLRTSEIINSKKAKYENSSSK